MTLNIHSTCFKGTCTIQLYKRGLKIDIENNTYLLITIGRFMSENVRLLSTSFGFITWKQRRIRWYVIKVNYKTIFVFVCYTECSSKYLRREHILFS